MCDPAYEACTGNPEDDTWYYKYFYRNAQNLPLCDPNDENCAALTCEEGEADCIEVACTAELVLAHELETDCSDPEVYNTEHPPEEEDIVENVEETGTDDQGDAEFPIDIPPEEEEAE